MHVQLTTAPSSCPLLSNAYNAVKIQTYGNEYLLVLRIALLPDNLSLLSVWGALFNT